MEQVLGHDLAEPGGQCLVRLHPGLHLLGGEDGAAVGERRNVAGGLHHSVPPGQHLQPVLLHQHLPKHTQLLVRWWRPKRSICINSII